MTPERWQQIEEVLQVALDLPAQDREQFLEGLCGDDADLKRETNSLITAHDAAGDFIEKPALAEDAHILLGDTVGREIGPYKILNCLGSGGMGDVYLARDGRLDRQVALKILPPYLASDDARLLRFQREARAASALNHPNIVTIHEVGECDDIRYIAIEFIDGQTLRELIETKNLSVDEIIDITSQVASALSAAHKAGIIHRDIKPENIMRRADGLVKILDFGIAKLVEQQSGSDFGNTKAESRAQTEVGVVLGTVNYMSPEQARALPVDERTDIWSLGVVLYEMLLNELPFRGATQMDTLVSILERQPQSLKKLERHGPVQNVVTKAIHKEREKRYQTTDELIADLKLVRTSKKDISRETPVTGFRRQSKWWIPALVVLVLVAATAIVWRRAGLRLNPSNAVTPTSAVSNQRYLQMSRSEQLAFVSEQERRISTMMGDRPVTLSEEALNVVKAHVDHLAARSNNGGPEDQSLEALYKRAQKRVPSITPSFAARKVPVIIGIYLPVVESAYRECYENTNGAKGLFQFLPQTAELYGVSRSEMCDVEKMAPAAAHYIADRMAELGEDSESLTLVLLSYNRGPDRVRDDLRELRDMPGFQRNFWTLFAHRDKLDEQFRNESAAYVPAFLAAAIVGENPQAFGLPTPPLSTLSGKQ